jgi:Protein of unknown function (DUF3048) N-terminal domain/Protein of unknown function (DUF3048) C-terminal domain
VPITIDRRPFVVFAVTALLAGCGTQAQVVPRPRTQGPNITVAKIAPPAPAVPVTWPLTGVAVPEVAKRPALAVKIENPKEVRPQTGLDQADIVWEEVVEGGITRLVAVYQSVVPGEVGPIRSVRPMDPAIVGPLHGIVAFSGGQAGFVNALKAAGVQTISQDAGNDGFYRTKARRAPHNVFGTPAKFWAQADADHQAAPAVPFSFARHAEQATAAASGTPAAAVAITMSGYSHPGWTWDAASGTWLRTESGAAAMAASGARLAVTNVITMRVVLVDSGTRDPAGSVVPETQLVGGGEAMVATGGKTIPATWKKDATTGPLTFTGADGQVVKLAPGKTWVELVPTSTGAVSVS